MIRISSLSNDRVRRVHALQRSTRRRFREGMMVAEGHRLVAELLMSSLVLQEVFVTPSYVEENPSTMALLSESASSELVIAQVTEDVMAEMSDTRTPQGILAVLPIPDLQPFAKERFILIPDQVRDPGNLGTMLRTAWAAGVSEVLLPPGVVDHTNPKVVRAGMGAHFHLPICRCEWPQIWETVEGAQIWLAEAADGHSYDQVDWHGDVVLIIGGEADGASLGARRVADPIHIPMASGVESLNAGVAAAILLFEAARQRRGAV